MTPATDENPAKRQRTNNDIDDQHNKPTNAVTTAKLSLDSKVVSLYRELQPIVTKLGAEHLKLHTELKRQEATKERLAKEAEESDTEEASELD